MDKKDELEQVEAYFKKHPDKVKYSRKESGLPTSYIRLTDGKFLALGRTELGRGGFGRVKDSNSTDRQLQKFKSLPQMLKIQGLI
ncbi:MAG: hypothetical protein K0U24_05335 [Gammaproteobacteria bacterium]|nr:hypothetical protein [Gammaproteobacteria bacterium]MCH9763641.1 hypothetical protein [Gammaproteobacteria bacterium]